jgi:hypothetical protein
MDTECLVMMHVVLEPVGQPWISVKANNNLYHIKQLTTCETFNFEFYTSGSCVLQVAHFDKSDCDPTTAVIVKEVGFFGITNPKFAWAGTYVPDYPEHYPTKITPLPAQTYLGWNGVYELNFSVPVFTWMHKILNLGWLYD